MKIKLTILKRLALLCGTLAATASFGQTVYTWTNNATGLDLGTAANWNPNGVPNIGSGSVAGDTMFFNGVTTGPVVATSNGGGQTGSSVNNPLAGIYVHLGSSQTSPVSFVTTVASGASSGIRFNSITVDSGAGSFIMGTGSTTNCLDTVWGTSNPSGQGFTNNSINPIILNLDVRSRYGAGGAHTISFAGTGNFLITNDIANVNGASTLIAKDGTGTMYWTAGHNSFWGTITTINSPMNIWAGAIVLNSSGLFPATTTINNNGLLVLNAVGGSQTIANPVNGTGSIQVNNGVLTLSGANTYTGNTILSGGELIANRAEGGNGPLGIGGNISFTGGTLGFSAVNAFDYSPRFTNAANQAISIDTAGQNVTFTNALTSSGGTLAKLGSGTLTISGANTYSGATTISAGKLVIQGAQGNGIISMANSSALGVNQGGSQITPASLTVGTSSSATLEFNNVNSTTTAAIAAAGAVTAGGAITVNVNSGAFIIGQHYPLFSWGSGAPPPVTLGTLVGAGGNLSTNGNTIQLNVTSLAFVWTGLNNANWDVSTLNDWKVNGVAQVFANGGTALFDDTVTTANTNIIVNSTVSPASTTINNSTKPYSIDSTVNPIAAGSLTKNGNATLVMTGGANTYTGPTTINGGVLNVSTLATGGSPSDIGAASSAAANLVLNGGTLLYNGGGATIDHLFTLGTAGGTINDLGGGSLQLVNDGAIVMNGAGARTLTLAGTSVDELDSLLSDNGGATALTKSGAGQWIVTANNNISGAVTIAGGTLQVGNGGATGSVGSGNITINPAGSLLAFVTSGTVTNGTVSGTGLLTVDGGGTVVLPGNNSYSGGTTIANGSTLQVGIGGATGRLNASTGTIDDEGTLIFNTTGQFSYSDPITGGGNLVVTGGGTIVDVGANSYSGWTLIGTNSTFQPCQGNTGGLASSVVTNNGTLLMVRQDNGIFVYNGSITGSGRLFIDANNFNAGDVTLSGINDYTGGTFIGDNGLIVGDGATSGSITGNVTFVNSTQVPNDNTRTLAFNHADDITFAGNIVTNFSSTQNNRGLVSQLGAGTLTLTGTNTFAGGVFVSNGVMQVGNGGTSGTIGSGTATVFSLLKFNRSDSVTFAGGITGTGLVVQAGSGVLTLSGAVAIQQTLIDTNALTTNTYTGTLTVSNGTLVVTGGSVGNLLAVEGGAFAPASLSAGGSLVVSNDMAIHGGTILVPLNKSLLPQTNITVQGTLSRTGGSLTVTNVGPGLAPGDRFTIFNKAVPSGGAMTIVPPAGVTISNSLAIDGSITVLTAPTTINPNSPKLQFSVSGNTLNLGWPTNLGWILQTNSSSLLNTNQWFAYPGSTSITNVGITIDPKKTNVFFRMLHP